MRTLVEAEMNAAPISVLWTSNIVLPAVAAQLGAAVTPFGGWLSTTTQRLSRRPGMRVGIAMRAAVPSFRRIDQDGISYFALPERAGDIYDIAQADCDRVLSEFSPDILHAEGTEMAYTQRMLSSWTGARLVSLQGVINGHVPYQLGRLPIEAFVNPRRPGHLVVGLALWANDRFRFRQRLKAERDTIAMADYILGRTIWDRAQANWLNPGARYHDCPRILRDPFYKGCWTRADCEPFSMFLGNAASALKGAHFAVEALALIRRRYPEARLYIAGRDPWSMPRTSAQRLVGYAVYLMDLISDLGLREHVVFTGNLDAPAMADRMRRSHVVVLSSLIENSPNTLAEAMVLGVPTVASYAGGVSSMARDGDEALFYRAGDPAMLTWQVERVFSDDGLATRLSSATQSRARATHDPDAIIDKLISVYREIKTRQEVS